MFVYEMGIVDFYTGMTMLKDYIILSNFYNHNCNLEEGEICAPNYMLERELKSFLIKCFLEVTCKDTDWEGDIRGLDEIAIGAIPRPTAQVPYRFIVFKQNNNGDSFLVSEIEIDTYDEDDKKIDLVTKSIPVNSDKLISFFESSYDLVEDLFRHAFKKHYEANKNVTKENIVKIDQNSISGYEKIG